jgi:hypothetical protein
MSGGPSRVVADGAGFMAAAIARDRRGVRNRGPIVAWPVRAARALVIMAAFASTAVARHPFKECPCPIPKKFASPTLAVITMCR